MDTALESPRLVQQAPPSLTEAWDMVTSQLHLEMAQGAYNSYVTALKPISFKEGVFRLGCASRDAQRWVEQRLATRLVKLLEVAYQRPVRLSFTITTVDDGHVESAVGEGRAKRIKAEKTGKLGSTAVEPEPESEGDALPASPRKIQLQRAYGTERARIVQPERGMFITIYFLNRWLPLLGHSAMTIIMAARALCYWNVKTGEMRNVIETDMSELARRASVSVRTVKEVLNAPLVKQYFLRYKVRRVMTSNGVRTAGIVLFVRMDEPLTPEDQQEHQISEEEHWYTADFAGEDD